LARRDGQIKKPERFLIPAFPTLKSLPGSSLVMLALMFGLALGLMFRQFFGLVLGQLLRLMFGLVLRFVNFMAFALSCLRLRNEHRRKGEGDNRQNQHYFFHSLRECLYFPTGQFKGVRLYRLELTFAGYTQTSV
jgi:hypothetical protein